MAQATDVVFVPLTPLTARQAVGEATIGAISQASGSVLIDAAIGAGLGYFIAPPSKETSYAIGGGLATGIAGLLGLGGLLVYRYAIDR